MWYNVNVKKLSVSQVEKKLWLECKRIIRIRYPNTCYTCGATGLEASNWHTGHYYAKGALGSTMKYDLRILRPQCYHCNINLGGMGGMYREKMKTEIGVESEQELFDECRLSKGKPIKAIDHYLKLLTEYKKITE